MRVSVGIVLQCIFLVLASSAWAAEGGRVAIRSDARPEIGRLLLVWPEPVTAALAVAGDTATLRTSHSLDGDLAPAVGQLTAWLASGERLAAADGLELRLRAGIGARLIQLHPRLTVIELFRLGESTMLGIHARGCGTRPCNSLLDPPASRLTSNPNCCTAHICGQGEHAG